MMEIEIRAIVDNKDDLMGKLVNKGFENVKTTVQHDIMLDKPDASLFTSGKKIRIRIEDDGATLTYKGDINTDAEISKRLELNIEIDKNKINDYINFLTELGYPICFQIKKERVVMKKDNIAVTFDEWPIIGCMMEIEGSEDKIKKIAKEIAPEQKFSNYRLKELFQNKMDETGKTLDELKADYFEKSNFDLGHIELIVG